MTLTRGQKFERKGKCKNGRCSAMSSLARCDLNNKSDLLKLHDTCPNNKWFCQKMITFSPKQFQMEGSGFKSKLHKFFKGTQTAWNKFVKPALNTASPYFGMAVAAKTENPEIGKGTGNILKSISGGKFLSLTDLRGNGLRSKVM